jgi:hypothetical protein
MANSPTSELGLVDKVVFESILDTAAGGGCLEVTGYVNTDTIIPAGLIVSKKDSTTGLHAIIATTGTPGTFTGGTPWGIVARTQPLVTAGNNWVSIVIEGAVRVAALPYTLAAADITALKAALPKITFIEA